MQSCAIPAPMAPSPTTPTVRTSTARDPTGRSRRMLVEPRVAAVAHGERTDGEDEEQYEQFHGSQHACAPLSGQVEYSSVLIMEPDSWLGRAPSSRGLDGRARGQLRRGGARLHAVAVSQQIQTLERIVGERLLERPGGPRAVSSEAAPSAPPRGVDHRAPARRPGGHGGARAGPRRPAPDRRSRASARVLPAVMRRFTAEWPSVELC